MIYHVTTLAPRTSEEERERERESHCSLKVHATLNNIDDNEQKVNNNVVANAQTPALIKKYKRVRPRHGPVSISVAITPPGDLSATPIFDSHRRITLRNHELFRIKCPFYDPRSCLSFIPSSFFLSSLCLSPSFFSVLPFSLFLSVSVFFSLPRTSTLFGLIAPQRPSSVETWHDSVTSKS